MVQRELNLMKWSKDDLLSVVESLLLCSDKPLKISDFLSCMGESLTAKEVTSHLEILAKRYDKKDRGIRLRKLQVDFNLSLKMKTKNLFKGLKNLKPSDFQKFP